MKCMKPILVTLLLLTAVLLQPAARGAIESAQAEQEEPFATITDSRDREVVIQEKPETIISLGPNVTETLFALGLGDAVIGRTDFCDYPEDVLDIQTIGGIMDPSIEKIIDLEPDLVLASTHVDMSIVQALEEAGITMVNLYSDENYEGVYITIREIALVTGTEEKGEAIIAEMKETISYVEETVAGAPKPTVYYVIEFGDAGDFTATGETYLHQLIELAGGKNIAADAKGWIFSLERIVEEDPDIIVCTTRFNTKERLKQAHGYKELTAVKEGRIHEMNTDKLDRQGARLAQGILELAKAFHPDLFD